MTTVLLTVTPPTAVLRDVILGPGEVPFGLPEALLVLGITVLLILLAGVVFWRVRRPPRNRSK